MEVIRLDFREYLIYILIFGFILGALLGLIPFLLGRRRGQARFGFYSLLASALVGTAAPVLSIVLVGITSWVIIQRGKAKPASVPETESTADVSPDE